MLQQKTQEELREYNFNQLSPFDRERLSFLNTSQRLMKNGNTMTLRPQNEFSNVQIKLFESIKDKMKESNHRKI